MSRETALARGRAAAERGMIDTCTIRRVASEVVNDLGATSHTYVEVYSGKCRLQQARAQGRAETPGEAYVVMGQRELQLPVFTSTGLRVKDIAVMDTCVNDPEMVGKELIVQDEAGKSEATARRLFVQERTG